MHSVTLDQRIKPVMRLEPSNFNPIVKIDGAYMFPYADSDPARSSQAYIPARGETEQEFAVRK